MKTYDEKDELQSFLTNYLAENRFDNDTAVLSHYISLQGSKAAYIYKKILEEHNVNLDKIPSKQAYQKKFSQYNPKKSNFTFIDLFAGIGGFRLAMQDNGGECVFSSEWDAAAKKTYACNYGEVPFGDITKIDTANIPDFDICCGGFPCQPFSYAGLCQGFSDKTRGTLFFEICRIISHKKPKMIFLENVKGLVSHKNGQTLKIIEQELKLLGYDIHWKILNSLDYGLPQKRERWYCVGFDKKIDFEFPKPINKRTILRDIIDLTNQDNSLKLTTFELDRIKYHFANCKNNERVQHDNSKYAANTKKGKYGIFSYQKPDGSLRFHVGDVAKTQIQEAFYACLNTYAPTIIAGRTPKLWDLKRKLSILEAKRLQGFLDNFKFTVSAHQAYKQLGNSVSIPIITLIIKNMINAYKK